MQIEDITIEVYPLMSRLPRSLEEPIGILSNLKFGMTPISFLSLRTFDAIHNATPLQFFPRFRAIASY